MTVWYGTTPATVHSASLFLAKVNITYSREYYLDAAREIFASGREVMDGDGGLTRVETVRWWHPTMRSSPLFVQRGRMG